MLEQRGREIGKMVLQSEEVLLDGRLGYGG
jgi:hypothetical protein